MNSSSVVALYIARADDTARSALPNAPMVPEESAARSASWSVRRGELATLLHRLAWALESHTSRAR
jgi:hypothetical protein